MITQAIQKRILEFNEKIFQTLHNRKNKKNKIKILGNEELKEAA
jgi:hypothetical protein